MPPAPRHVTPSKLRSYSTQSNNNNNNNSSSSSSSSSQTDNSIRRDSQCQLRTTIRPPLSCLCQLPQLHQADCLHPKTRATSRSVLARQVIGFRFRPQQPASTSKSQCPSPPCLWLSMPIPCKPMRILKLGLVVPNGQTSMLMWVCGEAAGSRF